MLFRAAVIKKRMERRVHRAAAEVGKGYPRTVRGAKKGGHSLT